MRRPTPQWRRQLSGLLAAALATTCCQLSPAAWAASPITGLPASLNLAQLNLASFTVPSDLGEVVETWQPKDALPQGLVLHVQDIHASPEVAAETATLLERWKREYGVGVVALEGASGALNLEPYWSLPDPALTEQAARLFLRAGVFTGAEYFAVTHPDGAALWGPEDAGLYRAHVDAYRQGVSARGPLLETLRRLEQALVARQQMVYPRSAARLVELRHGYEAHPEETRYRSYLEALIALAKTHQVSIDRFPHLARLRGAERLHAGLRMPKIRQQHDALVRTLRQRLRGQERAALETLLDAFAAGNVDERFYYAQLLQREAPAWWEAIRHNDLRTYAAYLAAVHALTSSRLTKELDAFHRAVEWAMLTADDQRAACTARERIQLLTRLVSYTLLPEEYQRYRSVPQAYTAAALGALLTQALPEEEFPTSQALALIVSQRSTYEAFYELALRRDQALFERSAQQLAQQATPGLVLVTGGFHTAGLVQRLRAANIAYAVVAPRITTPIDPRIYARRMSGELPTMQELLAGGVPERLLSPVPALQDPEIFPLFKGVSEAIQVQPDRGAASLARIAGKAKQALDGSLVATRIKRSGKQGDVWLGYGSARPTDQSVVIKIDTADGGAFRFWCDLAVPAILDREGQRVDQETLNATHQQDGSVRLRGTLLGPLQLTIPRDQPLRVRGGELVAFASLAGPPVPKWRVGLELGKKPLPRAMEKGEDDGLTDPAVIVASWSLGRRGQVHMDLEVAYFDPLQLALGKTTDLSGLGMYNRFVEAVDQALPEGSEVRISRIVNLRTRRVLNAEVKQLLEQPEWVDVAPLVKARGVTRPDVSMIRWSLLAAELGTPRMFAFKQAVERVLPQTDLARPWSQRGYVLMIDEQAPFRELHVVATKPTSDSPSERVTVYGGLRADGTRVAVEVSPAELEELQAPAAQLEVPATVAEYLRQDPNARAVRLRPLHEAAGEVGPLEILDARQVAAIGGHAQLEESTAFFVGSDEQARRMVRRGLPLIVAVTDQGPYPGTSMAHGRTVFIPLLDGTFLGLKGSGQQLNPSKPLQYPDPTHGRHLGLTTGTEQAWAREAAREIGELDPYLVQVMAIRPLLQVPNDEGELVPTAPFVHPRSPEQPLEPALFFVHVRELHRFSELWAGMLKADPDLGAMRTHLTQTLRASGEWHGEGVMTVGEWLRYVAVQFGRTEAKKQNAGWAKLTIHEQDLTLAGEEADPDEWMRLDDYIARLREDGKLPLDAELLTRERLDLAGVAAKLNALATAITHLPADGHGGVATAADRLASLETFFRHYFGTLHARHLQLWAEESSRPLAVLFKLVALERFHPAAGAAAGYASSALRGEVMAQVRLWANEELAGRQAAARQQESGATGAAVLQDTRDTGAPAPALAATREPSELSPLVLGNRDQPIAGQVQRGPGDGAGPGAAKRNGAEFNDPIKGAPDDMTRILPAVDRWESTYHAYELLGLERSAMTPAFDASKDEQAAGARALQDWLSDPTVDLQQPLMLVNMLGIADSEVLSQEEWIVIISRLVRQTSGRVVLVHGGSENQGRAFVEDVGAYVKERLPRDQRHRLLVPTAPLELRSNLPAIFSALQAHHAALVTVNTGLLHVASLYGFPIAVITSEHLNRWVPAKPSIQIIPVPIMSSSRPSERAKRIVPVVEQGLDRFLKQVTSGQASESGPLLPSSPYAYSGGPSWQQIKAGASRLIQEVRALLRASLQRTAPAMPLPIMFPPGEDIRARDQEAITRALSAPGRLEAAYANTDGVRIDRSKLKAVHISLHSTEGQRKIVYRVELETTQRTWFGRSLSVGQRTVALKVVRPSAERAGHLEGALFFPEHLEQMREDALALYRHEMPIGPRPGEYTRVRLADGEEVAVLIDDFIPGPTNWQYRQLPGATMEMGIRRAVRSYIECWLAWNRKLYIMDPKQDNLVLGQISGNGDSYWRLIDLDRVGTLEHVKKALGIEDLPFSGFPALITDMLHQVQIIRQPLNQTIPAERAMLFDGIRDALPEDEWRPFLEEARTDFTEVLKVIRSRMASYERYQDDTYDSDIPDYGPMRDRLTALVKEIDLYLREGHNFYTPDRFPRSALRRLQDLIR